MIYVTPDAISETWGNETKGVAYSKVSVPTGINTMWLTEYCIIYTIYIYLFIYIYLYLYLEDQRDAVLSRLYLFYC